MPTIKFTPVECAALLHRLTVPDCIAARKVEAALGMAAGSITTPEA